jgi:hypothetical protein
MSKNPNNYLSKTIDISYIQRTLDMWIEVFQLSVIPKQKIPNIYED